MELRTFSLVWLWLAMGLFTARAQLTVTTTDAFGETVVISEQTDVNGAPIATQVLSTLSSTSSSTTSSTSTSTTDDTGGGGGPIGYTTSTAGQVGPTTYVYTTTNANGQKTLVTAVFTPTYEPTSPWPTPSKGTIVPYSVYSSANPISSSGSGRRMDGSGVRRTMWALGATAMGVVAGAVYLL